MEAMNCAFCGHDFDASLAAPSCANCVIAGGCGMVRCPNCGFETPAKTRLATLAEGISSLLNNLIRR